MMSTAAPLHELRSWDSAAKVTAINSHEYAADVQPQSCFGLAAHGGAVAGMVWRAILLHFETTHKKMNQHDIVAFHIEFVRPSSQGEAKVVIRDVRIGKTSSIIGASFVQKGKETVLVYATILSDRATPLTQPMNYKHNLPDINFDALQANRDPNWAFTGWKRSSAKNQTAVQHVMVGVPRVVDRTAHDWAVWYAPRLPGVRWTSADLGIVTDLNHHMPEAYHADSTYHPLYTVEHALRTERAGTDPFSQPLWSVPRYYTTVSVSIDVRRQLPAEGEKWLLVRGKTRELRNGRYEIQHEIWDPHGQLIAVSQSLWFCIDFKKRWETLPEDSPKKEQSKI